MLAEEHQCSHLQVLHESVVSSLLADKLHFKNPGSSPHLSMAHGLSKSPSELINVGVMQHLTCDVLVPHLRLLPRCLGYASTNLTLLQKTPKMISTNPAQQKDKPKHKDHASSARLQKWWQFTIIILYCIIVVLQAGEDLVAEFA